MLSLQRSCSKDTLHDAVKRAMNVAHIQDLPVETISELAWELEVATAEAE